MTISSTNRKAGPYAGNDTAAEFPFDFKVFAASDLLVVQANSTGAETEMTLDTDYTVTINADQDANPGGMVVLPNALAAGYTLVIASKLENLQPADLTNQGGFYPKVINNALDRLTILIQQLAETVSRSLKMAITTPPGVKSELPSPAPYALIGWNAEGNGFQNTDPTYSTALATDLASEDDGKGASLVAFAVDRAYSPGTVGAALCDRGVSVKDFPFFAKGDGIQDDTAAIQAALDTGRSIFIPEGTYVVSGTLTIATSGQSVVGAGNGLSIVRKTTAGSLFILAQGVTRYAFVRLGLRATVSDVKIVQMSGGNTYGDFFDVEFFKGYDAAMTSYGIYSAGTTGWSGLVNFTGCRWQAFSYGVFLQGIDPSTASTEFTFNGCEFNGCKHGIYDDQDNDTAGAFRLVNCDFEAPTDGRNQIASINGIGCSVLGCRFETKNGGGWGTLAAGDYTTHNPIHFGPNARRNFIAGVEAIPSTSGKILLHEGSRYGYLSGTDASNVYGPLGVVKANAVCSLHIGRDDQTIRFDYNSTTAEVKMHPTGGSTGRLILNSNNNSVEIRTADTGRVVFGNGSFFPSTDNAYLCGTSGNRWSVIYAGTGTINTSDEREKTDIREIDDAEQRVASALRGMIRAFRFKDAVADKGDEARTHFGVMAQQVAAAFAAEGLDASRYALFCYDEWPDEFEPVLIEEKVVDQETGEERSVWHETGETRLVRPAGNRYGVRYDELMAFILGAM